MPHVSNSTPLSSAPAPLVSTSSTMQKGISRSNSMPASMQTPYQHPSSTLDSPETTILSPSTSYQCRLLGHGRSNTVASTERSAARMNLFITLGGRLNVLDQGLVTPTPAELGWRSSAGSSTSKSSRLRATDGPDELSTSAGSPATPPSLYNQQPLTESTPFSEQLSTTHSDGRTASGRRRNLAAPNQWKRRGMVIEEDDDTDFPSQSNDSAMGVVGTSLNHSLESPSRQGLFSPCDEEGEMASEEPEEIVYSAGYYRQSPRDAFEKEISWIADPVLEPYITTDSEDDGDKGQSPSIAVNGSDQNSPELLQEDLGPSTKEPSPPASLYAGHLALDVESSLERLSSPGSKTQDSLPRIRTFITATPLFPVEEDSDSSQPAYPHRLSVASHLQRDQSPLATGYESDNSFSASEAPLERKGSLGVWDRFRSVVIPNGSSDGSRSRKSRIATRGRSLSTESSVSWSSGRSLASPKVDKNELVLAYPSRGQRLVTQNSSASSSMQSLSLPTSPRRSIPSKRARNPYHAEYNQDAKLLPFPGIKELEEQRARARNRGQSMSSSLGSVPSLRGKKKEVTMAPSSSGNMSSSSLDIEWDPVLLHQVPNTHPFPQSTESLGSQLQSIAASVPHGQVPNGQSPGSVFVKTVPARRESFQRWLSKRFGSSSPTLASDLPCPTSQTMRPTLHSKRPSLSERLRWKKENDLPSDIEDACPPDKSRSPVSNRTLSFGRLHAGSWAAKATKKAAEAAVTKAEQPEHEETAIREAVWHAIEEKRDEEGDHAGSILPGDLSAHITRDGEFPVAAGGCADIYKGTLEVDRVEAKVAIKTIKVYSTENDDPKKTKRLRREIKVWMKLDHPNVLPLFGTTSGFGPFPAMVCPWLENGTLTSYLEHCDVDLELLQILALIHDVASGLQYLHSQSIVHGDISGSNVLIDANGRACIADFGLSTVLDEIGGSTFATSSTGKPRGTLRWAAPELLDLVEHGDVKALHSGPTIQSDIYSFGGIMLQILSGKIPYHYYHRDMQVVAAIYREETPMRPDGARVTDDRWGFIQRCWSPVRIIVQRPSSEEIVTFSNDDLVWNSPQAL